MIADQWESYFNRLPVAPNPQLARLMRSVFLAGAAGALAEVRIVANPEKPTLHELKDNIETLQLEVRTSAMESYHGG